MLLIQLTIVLLCMVGAAFFAGIETGMISIHRLRLRHFGNQKGNHKKGSDNPNSQTGRQNGAETHRTQ